MTTIAEALGPTMSRALARAVATWRYVPTWRRRAIRVAYPDLADALDELERGVREQWGA